MYGVGFCPSDYYCGPSPENEMQNSITKGGDFFSIQDES